MQKLTRFNQNHSFQRTTKSIIKCLIRVKVADFSIRVPLNKLANHRQYYKFSD
jgi:hypothetical protein